MDLSRSAGLKRALCVPAALSVLTVATIAAAQVIPPRAPSGPPSADTAPGNNPPGIWVDPPRAPSARDRRRHDGPNAHDEDTPSGQGCPVNDRELELIV